MAGEKAVVQVVVIAPLRHRKRKNGPWRYTRPAYLVCTDASIRVQDLIQAYFWRWGIEVNFKEQKQLFGAGEAQVRNEASAASAPAVCIASYAALLLAGVRTYGFDARPPSLSPPKWYKKKHLMRTTSSDLIRQMHNELMITASGHFSPLTLTTTPEWSAMTALPAETFPAAIQLPPKPFKQKKNVIFSETCLTARPTCATVANQFR